MKRLLFIASLAGIMFSCGVKVEVTNPLPLPRLLETVELQWSDVTAKLPEATPENIVAIAPDGTRQPSQVLYKGLEEPQSLIFQATVGPEETVAYQLKTGEREDYRAQAFGRYVPERLDDFAWENNLIAFRMYGPALEATGEISNGIDVWVKSTDRLVLNEWYRPGVNYHKDHGEGFDGYKVGRTLGGGAMAPYAKDSIWYGNNYAAYKVLDNGPIRISFELDYAPFRVDTIMVAERRTFSLDANTHFNRVTELYTGDFDRMKVVAGIVTRGAGGKVLDIPNEPATAVGYWEPVNRDNNMDNGNTGLGLVFPCEIKVETAQLHLLAGTTVRQGQPFSYLVGAAWSKSDMPTPEAWAQEIYNQGLKFNNPLTVTVK